jgi:ubiquinone/menaquinone biosynthesis C-methylase UbiE
MSETEIKQQVRNFYDQIGWKLESDGFYQNARYEDLRPVAKEYIEKCHLRINRHLVKNGKYLLDAGSGPIQYPAYLTYMDGYQYRLCMDISTVALQEARKRIGEKGLFVVGDVAKLPFKDVSFDGIVSLHTLHHLPLEEQKNAYRDIHRVLKKEKNAVIVNGWTKSKLMTQWSWLLKLMDRIGSIFLRLSGKKQLQQNTSEETKTIEKKSPQKKQTGTFIEKLNANWLREELKEMDLEILVWRSVSVKFLRAVFHQALGGKFWLRVLFYLEEKYPKYFGENGQYPLIVIRK